MWNYEIHVDGMNGGRALTCRNVIEPVIGKRAGFQALKVFSHKSLFYF
jgi:hypothetical protein